MSGSDGDSDTDSYDSIVAHYGYVSIRIYPYDFRPKRYTPATTRQLDAYRFSNRWRNELPAYPDVNNRIIFPTIEQWWGPA